MADISVMNVGGTDYNIKDSTSRTNSTNAMSLPAYYETGNTASQAYSVVGTPINWKGTLYYTKTTVAKGATWTVGTNLTAATNLGKLVRNIKTYVGSDSKLHFVDLTGADTALNFSGAGDLHKLSKDLLGASQANTSINNLITNTLGLSTDDLTQVTTFDPYSNTEGNYTIPADGKYVFALMAYANASYTGMSFNLSVYSSSDESDSIVCAKKSQSWTGNGYAVMIYGTFFKDNYLKWTRSGTPSSLANTYGRLFRYE